MLRSDVAAANWTIIKLQHNPVITQHSHSVGGVFQAQIQLSVVSSSVWWIVSVTKHESASTSQTFPLPLFWSCLPQRVCIVLPSRQWSSWSGFPAPAYMSNLFYILEEKTTIVPHRSCGQLYSRITELMFVAGKKKKSLSGWGAHKVWPNNWAICRILVFVWNSWDGESRSCAPVFTKHPQVTADVCVVSLSWRHCG